MVKWKVKGLLVNIQLIKKKSFVLRKYRNPLWGFIAVPKVFK